MSNKAEPAGELLHSLIMLSKTGSCAPNLAQFHAAFEHTRQLSNNTIDQAAMGGALGDRLAFAFAAGYQSALKALFAERLHGWASFCVTEASGNSPKAIATSMDEQDNHWTLNGSKTFVTGCKEAQLLFVAACEGVAEDGLKNIRMVCVDKSTPGICVEIMPELPFVPEISHGVVHFKNVAFKALDILPGDGYLNYVKPFRTIEDLHVLAAVLGYIISRALATRWQRELLEQLLACLFAHRSLATMPALSAELHIALAGVRSQFENLLPEIEAQWQSKDAERFDAWERDKKLLSIAGSAREKRREAAWQKILAD